MSESILDKLWAATSVATLTLTLTLTPTTTTTTRRLVYGGAIHSNDSNQWLLQSRYAATGCIEILQASFGDLTTHCFRAEYSQMRARQPSAWLPPARISVDLVRAGGIPQDRKKKRTSKCQHPTCHFRLGSVSDSRSRKPDSLEILEQINKAIQPYVPYRYV